MRASRSALSASGSVCMPSQMIRSEPTRTVPRLPARIFNYATYQPICANWIKRCQAGRAHLEIGKEAQICRNFVRCGAERSQRSEDINVDLARIRLRRDWVRVRETRHICNQSIEFLHLFIVGMARRERGHSVKPDAPCHGRHQTVRGSSPAFPWCL